MRTVPSRARAALLLGVLLVPTVLLGYRGIVVPIDVENHALKSVGTREAASLERRIASFGSDEALLVAFDERAPDATLPPLDAVTRRVQEVEGVSAVREWPLASSTSRVFVVELDAPAGAFAPVVDEVRRAIDETTPPGVRAALSGQPLAEVVIAAEVQAEQKRVLPLLAGALVLLLFLYYRHAGLVAAILLPAAAGIAWTSGLFALTGRRLDPVSVMLQPVLLTVGVASGVHWIEAYLEKRKHGLAASEAASSAIDDLRIPALMAALTTVIGFASLAFNAIPAVVDFGVFAALGVGATYWLASVMTPALLVLCAAHVSDGLLARRGRSLNLLGKRTADWLAERAIAIRVGAVILGVAGLALAARIEVDNDPQTVLPEDHPFRRDSRIVAERIGGNDVFDLFVPKESRFADPVALGLLAASVVREPGVAGPAGPPLRSANGDWLVRFLLVPSGSTARERLFEAVEARARALGAPEVQAAGTSVQIARDSGRLIRSTLWGTGTSLVALFAIFWISFRSAFYAWLALVPNILPCIVVYGGMAAFGRPLSFATAMISSVMLGLIVDDTIHLLHHYRELRANGASSLAAIERVYQSSGRATVITSVVLGAGFSVGLLGRLSTTTDFCSVAAITIAVAFLSDLVLLPAMLVEREVAPAGEPEAVRA